MILTPIDIQQQQFRKAMRGFDRREVQAFLDLVAQRVGDLTRENNDLRAELRRSQRELEEHRDREETLKQAMVTAQNAIEEIREQAQKEAQLVISESELRSEKILHNAHNRVAKILDEISELKRQRVRAIEELRGIVSTHGKLLDLYDEGTHQLQEPEGSITVLERIRAPAPPSTVELDLAQIAR